MAHHGVSFTMETPAEPQEVIMKCPFCGVHYVKGAAHWSECPYSDANRTVKP
jgi:hypothetical protein